MLNVILAIPKIFSKYFDQFERIFSKRLQALSLYYMTGLLMEYKRFSIKELAAKAPINKYQSYQYFLSEAKWDQNELNRQRIRDLNSLKQAKSSKAGVLILDDTSNKKSKNCKKTDSVARQHSNMEEGIVNCQVSVYTCYADLKKAWPVDFKVYWPEKTYFKSKDPNLVFRSKIELGMDLILEAQQIGINFSYVTFDSWYPSNEMIEFCQKEAKVKFISEIDVKRWVERNGQWLKAGELVKLAQEKHTCLKSARIHTKTGESIYYYQQWVGRLNQIGFDLRFILTMGINEDGSTFFKLLVTNDLGAPAQQIIQGYSLRWNIEVVFERLKSYFYLDHFQVHSVQAFSRHYYLAMLAYSFVLIHLSCGSFAKMTQNPPTTFEQAIFLLRDLITCESLDQACTNKVLALRYKDLRLKNVAS